MEAYKRMAVLVNDASIAARAPHEYGSSFLLRASLTRISKEDVMDCASDVACASQFWDACQSLGNINCSAAAKSVAAQTLRALEDQVWRIGQRPRRPSPVRADL